MKWSDGEPFTADDIVFAYNDVVLNTEINPVTPEYLTSDGKPSTVEKVDETTVKVVFAQPNGLFIKKLGNQVHLISAPRHYMQQFHKKYNKDVERPGEEGEARPAGASSISPRPTCGPTPTSRRLHAWKVVNPLGKGNRVVLERNPYYWKTDADGSQLPYIDKVIFDLVSEAQVILLRGTNGELSLSTRHINTLPNKPVLAQGREKGDYRFIDAREHLHERHGALV